MSGTPMQMLCLMMVLAATPAEWQSLDKGIEYRTFNLRKPLLTGDGVLHVVRVDPSQASLGFGIASRDGEWKTAAEWSAAKSFAVVINAGMFHTDARNVGHLVDDDHVDRAKWNKYQSVLLIGAKKKGLPAAQLVDKDAPGFDALAKNYASAVQNLRLIARDGENLWKPNGRRWSEAMVAQDAEGRLLFLFTRTPYEMADLNAQVLALPLGLKRAMHVEGGPEASLSIHTKDVNLDLFGSYETGFRADDSNSEAWRLPNVLGVRAPAPE